MADRAFIGRPYLPGLHVQGEMGAGGFARVWRALRRAEGDEVAVKVGHGPGALVRGCFAREAAALAALGAPHTPALFGQGVLDDGRPYLIMELLAGEPLSACRPTDAPALGWIVRVCTAILDNLAAVHAGGLAHLDLKPANVMVSEHGRRARLVDFGSCRRGDAGADTGADAGAAGAVPGVPMAVGSADYAAPERITDGAVSAATDIYSFGVILYELLTGRLPFLGDRDRVSHGHISLCPPRPASLATVPAAVEALCLACLSKRPEERPRGARAARAALLQALAAAPRSAPPRAAPRGPDAPSPDAVHLLSGARQPVVLLAAEGTLPQSAVIAVVGRHRGFVARLQGRRYVCAFSGVLGETPLDDALEAARALRNQHGARVTLHIAELQVRAGRSGRPPKVYGPAGDHPETWLPDAPWSEVYLTPAVAEVLQEPVTRSQSDPEFFVLAAGAGPHSSAPACSPLYAVDLVGRDRALARARRSVRTCFEQAAPRLLTIVGDHGLGKTRLCRELSRMAVDAAPGAAVISLRASRPSPACAHPTFTALCEAVQGLVETEIAEVMHDASTGRSLSVQGLGDELRRMAGAGPVAVIVDDVHYAGDAVLDALEYAGLDGPGMALWIAVAGLPRFERRRPTWAHAHRRDRITLEPLAEADAMTLAVALLRPAEYPPPAFLGQLAEWTAGNPYLLTALVATIKSAGLVRQGRQHGSWYVATEELAHLPALPVGQWLAERELGRLSPELAACARVCSVLGSEFLREELVWVQRAAELERVATTSIDIGVGLEALERHGILLRQGSDVWAFREVLFQDGIYKLIGRRDREQIHRSALGFWRARPGSPDPERALAAMARHAEAIADTEVAARACVELGHRARVAHRHVEAELHYTRALELIAKDDDAHRVEALRGRGKVRYRLQRIHEAIEDLRRAQRLAAAMGQDAALADLLIEESTALDWAGKYEESAALVERALPLMGGRADRRLDGRYLMAWGRSRYREERAAEAFEALERALVAGEDDPETAIIALLLLGPLCVQIERLDEAARRFDEAIALCARTRDRFHLCAAYLNRAWLWLARESLDEAMADLDRAARLARELGQPILERGAVHNQAELLHWSGQHESARGPAQRAYELQRFLPDPVPRDALLLGRVLAACDQLGEAQCLVAHARCLMRDDGPGTSRDELALRMLELTLADAAGEPGAAAWDELIALAHVHLPGEELLEIHYFRACMAARAARWAELGKILGEARPVLHRCPIWREPFASLAATLARRDRC